jgi:hypothetical protein
MLIVGDICDVDLDTRQICNECCRDSYEYQENGWDWPGY